MIPAQLIEDKRCPVPITCRDIHRCIYQCYKDPVHAKWLYQQEVVENFRSGRDSTLLKVTSVAEENRREAKMEIIKARVAFYSFMWGVGLTLLACWLLKK